MRSLMKAFAQMGDRAQAIREFERCRQALRTVLDLPPSNETVAVYEAIRTNAPSSPPDLRGTRRRHSARLRRPGRSAAVRFPLGDRNQRSRCRSADDGRSSRREPSIAVLPFRNLTGDPAHHSSPRASSRILSKWSRVPNLFVVSRLSTLAFRESGSPPARDRRRAGGSLCSLGQFPGCG